MHRLLECVFVYPGRFFGETAYCDGSGQRTTTIKAASDVKMIKLNINDLKAVNFDPFLFDVSRQDFIQTEAGCIFVDVLSATDLLAMDKSGFSDPYITCKAGSHEATTTIKRQTLNPVWNESLEIPIDENPDALFVECFDWDLKGEDDPMGNGMVDLTTVGHNPSTVVVQLLLHGETVGSVTLRVRLWEPKFSPDRASAKLQRAFRGHRCRSMVRKMRHAQSTMHQTSEIAAAMTEQRVRQLSNLLQQKQDSLQQQTLSRDFEDQAVGAPKNQQQAVLHGLGNHYLSDSDEEDTQAATRKPIASTSSTQKSGSKDRIDWSGPDWKEKLIAERWKTKAKFRSQWFVPSMLREESVKTMKEKKSVVFERSLQLIRRATVQYYFSSAQVGRLLETVYDDDTYKDNVLVGKPVGLQHVELLTAVFSRISDIENMDFRKILGHTTYDADGNHSVSVDEIVYLRQHPPPFVILTDRLGVANLFNPLLPDGEYALNLRIRDERQVAQMLVLLSTEPGDNMVYETFNGVPFDVGAKWLQAVPDVGWFCLQYVTPPACASLKLRTSLAQRLLNPGKGRWVCIPPAQRMHRDDPMNAMWMNSSDDDVVLEGEVDLPGPGEYMVDADGTLKERSHTDMAALEQAAKEHKQRRKAARKAQEAEMATMTDADREEAEKTAADHKAAVLGRRVAEGEWVTYANVQDAATALGLPTTEVVKTARGQQDSTGGFEFTYAEKSKEQGLSTGVILSLTRIKKKLQDKLEKAAEQKAAESSGSSPRTTTRTTQVSIDQDDVQAVLEVARSVGTAKAHWRRLRRVTKLMMMFRNTQGGRNTDRIGDVVRTVT